jgi:hypothetical protein
MTNQDLRSAIGVNLLDRYNQETSFNLKAILEDMNYLPSQESDAGGSHE